MRVNLENLRAQGSAAISRFLASGDVALLIEIRKIQDWIAACKRRRGKGAMACCDDWVDDWNPPEASR